MTPTMKLGIASLGGIYLVKAAALAVRGRPGGVGLWAFLLAWPGAAPDRFCERGPALPIDAGRYLGGWARMAAGAATIVLLGGFAPSISDRVLGLAGIAALLLTIHVGICDVLPWLLRWMGFDVPLLFDRPWAARSLAEFWGRRWNLAFVEMNQRLLLRGLYRRYGRRGARFALFALSGVLHELGLSFPAGAGWGLPLGYFLLQGLLIEVEERFRIAGRWWTWFWVVAPAPWLFHQAFRQALVVPFYRGLHEMLARHEAQWYLSGLLYAAAVGHLLVLVASFQAPVRLGWRQDIPKLTRFNQKIFWVYGFYILLSIVGFAVLTWRLHAALLAGEAAARGLAGFIAVFWTVRVLVDVCWYDHRDWPRGNAMVAGHALVTSLFCGLAGVYWVTALR